MKRRIGAAVLGLCVWMAVFGGGAQAASIAKGPCLIYPNLNTEMTVLWQLDSTSACALEWGLDTSYSGGSAPTTEYGVDHQHKATLTGLAPGSLYYYRVSFGTSQYTGSFRAAPSASAADVKFLAYGDTRTNPNLHDSVCAAINSAIAADPECQTFLLHAGDWVAIGENEANWTNEYFNRSWPNAIGMQANIPIQGCMGNHEGAGTLFQKYWPYPFAAYRYYSFDYGPVHVAVVDQYADFSAGSTQMTWLANDLSGSAQPWKFILLHAPGWSAAGVGGHPNNALVQSAIQPLCLANGVDIVFGGHNHYYARCDVDGVHHLTLGGGGAPLDTPDPLQPYVVACQSTLHYCKISITGNDLACQAINAGGSVIDAFSVNHPASGVRNWQRYASLPEMWKPLNEDAAVETRLAAVGATRSN